MHLRTIARQIGGALLLIWFVLTLTFVLVRLAPGDPAALLVPPAASAAEIEQLTASLGLDRPIAVQYARWSAGVLRGDLGVSFVRNRPVTEILAEGLPISIALGVASLTLTFLVGVPLGMLQAARRNTITDRVLTVLTIGVYAAPTFWVALALVGVFTYGASVWGLPPALRLPAFGIETPGSTLEGWARLRDIARHSLLPVLILAAVGAAGIARYARTHVADVLREDFVRSARAKGASTGRIYLRHVLATVLPPLVVLFALALPGVVAGSVFIEAVFAWPGIGRITLNAITARDYPVVMGATAVYASVGIIANMAADLALPLLDPRRRAS